jgi:hypothetical protein
MGRNLNHERRNGWSASAAGRSNAARAELEGQYSTIAVAPETRAWYQRALAEIKVHPAFVAPPFLANLEHQLATMPNILGATRQINMWRVKLGIVAHDPRRAAEAERARRLANGRKARAGFERGTFKAGLARLDAVQAARPLKPPSAPRKIEE